MSVIKYLFYLMFSLVADFVVCNVCEDEFYDATLTYRECIKKADLSFMQGKKSKDLNVEEFCKMLDVSDNCTDTAEHLVKHCSNFQESQLDNHLSGLRAYQAFECDEKHLMDEHSVEIKECEILQKERTFDCNSKLNYSYALFLPIPVVEDILDLNLWSENDCRLKFKWMDCWVKALNYCRNKKARDHYKKLFTTILRAYPSCKRTLGEKLETYALPRWPYQERDMEKDKEDPPKISSSDHISILNILSITFPCILIFILHF